MSLVEQLQQVLDYRHIRELFADIQGHWGIENRLHWVRDVTFKEDFPPRCGGNAPVNWALLDNFFITIGCKLRFRTIPQAQRAFSNQLHKESFFFFCMKPSCPASPACPNSSHCSATPILYGSGMPLQTNLSGCYFSNIFSKSANLPE